MTPTRRTATYRLDDDLLEGLQLVWERDRIQPSEQVRVAIRQWLESKGVLRKQKAERKRAVTRKRR